MKQREKFYRKPDGSIVFLACKDSNEFAERGLLHAAPTPPEVEPVGIVHANRVSYSVEIFEAYENLPDGTKLFTSPPSPKAEYDAEGNPLNLMAAADDACKFLEGYCVALETLGKSELPVHEGSIKKITSSLRKFIGGGMSKIDTSTDTVVREANEFIENHQVRLIHYGWGIMDKDGDYAGSHYRKELADLNSKFHSGYNKKDGPFRVVELFYKDGDWE